MKTRIKTHSFPGDVNRKTKTAMLEGRHPNKKQAKSLKKNYVLSRERAVLKVRTARELKGY
jgi:hypothetical protein